jgi:hypothetical protein
MLSKRNIKIIAAYISLTLIVLAVFYFQRIDEKVESQMIENDRDLVRMSSPEMLQLKTGDLIFRKGYGMVSEWVSTYLEHGPYDLTHVGIVMVRPTGVFVAHALSSKKMEVNGVIIQPLNEFLEASNPENILVVRWKNYSSTMDSGLWSSVNTYVREKIPFDKEADYDDSSALYCNEMIVKLWMNELGLIDPPKNSIEKKYRFHNLSVLYEPSSTDIIFSTFQRYDD